VTLLAMPTKQDAARLKDWLVLGGLSTGGGLLLSAVLAAVLWLVEHFLGWPPRRNPLLWIDEDQR
jgi:hypothetical protein